MAQHVADKITKLYERRYISALILIAVLISVEWIAARLIIEHHDTTYAAVNISGRQRMLSQRINAMASYALNAQSQEEIDTAIARLQQTSDLFADSHTKLIEGDADLNLAPLNNQLIEDIYFGETNLDQRIKNYVQLSKRITFETDNVIRRKAAQEISALSEGLLFDLDNVVSLYEQEGQQAVERINTVLNIVVAITLFILVLLGIFIFAPAGRVLRRSIVDQVEARRIAEAQRKIAEESSEAKSRFLAMMSHELRTPLTAILGYGVLIKSAPDKEETLNQTEVKSYVANIVNAGNHLLAIVNDVLDFAASENTDIALNFGIFNLRACINDIAELTRPQCTAANIQLNIEIDQNVPAKVTSDETRLRQILINLVGNAIKFSKEGTVTLKARAEPLPDNKVKLAFDVIDNGIGIPPDMLSQIFEPFQQVESGNQRTYGGTGLGLAITKTLIQALGGEIYVESEEGKGTAMHFYLIAVAA